jgi:hypothetical protein
MRRNVSLVLRALLHHLCGSFRQHLQWWVWCGCALMMMMLMVVVVVVVVVVVGPWWWDRVAGVEESTVALAYQSPPLRGS